METTDGVYVPAVTDALEPIEIPFYYLGLNTVPKRFVAGATATAALLYAIKPVSMFYDNGKPKAFSLTSKQDGATLMPWWLMSLAVGGILATFV